MDNSFGSVTLDLIINYKSDNSSVESFTDNGYFIVKNVSSDDVFLVFDLETGIWRDINTVNNFCGAYNPIDTFWVDLPIAPSNIDYWRTPPTTRDYGPFDFYWDGKSEVYVAGGLRSIANHEPSFNPLIRTDGALIIEINGTIMGPFGDSNNRNYFMHDYNINKYLHSGDHNILKVSVYSTYNVIGNYFIWLTEKGVRLEDGKADRLFPTPTECLNELNNNIINLDNTLLNLINNLYNAQNWWRGNEITNITQNDSPVEIPINNVIDNWYNNENEIPNPSTHIIDIPFYVNGQWVWVRLYAYI